MIETLSATSSPPVPGEMTTLTAQELSDVIKTMHVDLRVKYQQDGSAGWKRHTEDVPRLKQYAVAMHTLATTYWENAITKKANNSRIVWTYNALRQYYCTDQCTLCHLKEIRKAQHFGVISQIEEHNLTLSQSGDNCDSTQPLSTASQNSDNSELTPYSIRNSSVQHEPVRRFKVLDVGSCYNPFAGYHDLDVTALDLYPATKGVFQCDFLNLQVQDKTDQSTTQTNLYSEKPTDSVHSTDHSETKNAPPFRTISSLTASSFDAVFFCFFLSYIPDPALRLECCKKAVQLLKPEGILILTSFDGENISKNVHAFKTWKITLMNIGLQRVAFHKDENFYGMVFRKALCPSLWKKDALNAIEKMNETKCALENSIHEKQNRRKKASRRERNLGGFSVENILKGIHFVWDLNKTLPVQGEQTNCQVLDYINGNDENGYSLTNRCPKRPRGGNDQLKSKCRKTEDKIAG